MAATPCKPEPAASFPTISRRRMTGTTASRDANQRGQHEEPLHHQARSTEGRRRLRHWGGAFLCRSGGGSRSTGSHSAYRAGQAAGERVTSAHIAACWSPKGGHHERHTLTTFCYGA